MSKSAPVSFLAHFAALRDPRQAAKVLYPLPEILLILLCGTLAGADDFVELALWGRENLRFLRRFARFVRGIPSHDTLCEVIAAIDPDAFRTCFTSWVDSLRAPGPEVIAIDGKTSRRSGARSRGGEPLHTVSAWATRQRLVLGQEAVQTKSNEITAIPLLLQRLELQGALVTIDAMGTQREVAQTILDGGGDYVLALKANWPATLKAVQALFDTAPRSRARDPSDRRYQSRSHRDQTLPRLFRLGRVLRAPRHPRQPGIPRRRHGRHGREQDRARRQDRAGDTILSVLHQAGCRNIRSRRARPLGHRKPVALGSRRRLPRRSRAPAH